MALGDLDGDGDIDAFVGNRGFGFNALWFNDGMGTFFDSMLNPGMADTWSVDDGDLDVYLGNNGNDESG